MLSDPRKQRGIDLAKAKAAAIKPIVGAKYLVPSASHGGGYVVDVDEKSCTCPDWQELGGHGRVHCCKHVWAVLVVRQEIELPDGSSVVTEQKLRIRYPRDWRATNAALVDLHRIAPALLADLVGGIPLREGPRGRGRPRSEARDVAHGALIKTFEERTARESVEAMERHKARGLWGERGMLHYNTLLRELQNPALTPVFQQLVTASARPLVAIERNFAVDSTGFSTSVYDSWFGHKHGGHKTHDPKKHRWVKCHGCVGTTTHVFTAVQITESRVGDAPMLPELVRRTVEGGFVLDKVTADAAYLSAANITTIEGAGAVPFIAFKESSTGTSSPAMARLYHRFLSEREYMPEYHDRSNVETGFSMVKTRFGGFLRSRKPLAQYHEVLAKIVCHNVACIVQAIHELNIDPKFWTPAPPTVLSGAAPLLLGGPT